MRIEDIKLGQTYLTRVHGELIRVIAVGIISDSERRKVRLQRAYDGRLLPGLRSASYLYKAPSLS